MPLFGAVAGQQFVLAIVAGAEGGHRVRGAGKGHV